MKKKPGTLVLLMLTSCSCFILLSPKWMFSPAGWIAPALLLSIMIDFKPWKAFLIGSAILFVSSIVANYKVMPFPTIVFVVMAFITSLQAAIPYWLTRALYHKISGWKQTLLLPCFLVIYEYLSSFGGAGSWGSLAYTQTSNLYLMQLVSVTGIGGVTFLIGWFSSLVVLAIEEKWNWSILKTRVTIFASVLFAVLGYGAVVTSLYINSANETIQVSGISGNNLSILVGMYEDKFNKHISVREDELSQTSSELAELNKAFVSFIENPQAENFVSSRRLLEQKWDSLFIISAKAAASGSKIIAWSEALAMVINEDEEQLISRGKKFCREHKVYLLMAIASIRPGKIKQGDKFIENKTVLVGPAGIVLNTFLKNKPVPIVEPSVAGDGTVPVIQTAFSRIAPSICYDADFPKLMQQLGRKNVDLLLLPAGDWKEISPYHAQIAITRAIENGCNLLRIGSGSSTIAVNYHGQIFGQRNYFDKGEKIMTAELPTKGIKTVYNLIGDLIVWICISFIIIVLIFYRAK